MKIGNEVKIIGIPQTESNMSNQDYKRYFGCIARINHIYKYGDRNIVVTVGKYEAILYYNESHLELINPLTFK